MTPQTAIFFDLDGTICDPREGIVRCLQYTLEKMGRKVPADDELVRYIGPPLHESLAALLDTKDGERVRRAVELYRERFVSSGMFENTIYQDILDALQKLESHHYPLHVVTSKLTIFARQIIDHVGLQKYFRNVHGSELDGTRADKAELIAHVLEQERIHPSEAVMIGDREHDVRGALANGVRPIAVLWGYGSREELTQAGASALCETPEDLVSRFC